MDRKGFSFFPECALDEIPGNDLYYKRTSIIWVRRVAPGYPWSWMQAENCCQTWRRIEVVITRLTRNQFAGQLARGFESRRLRFLPKGSATDSFFRTHGNKECRDFAIHTRERSDTLLFFSFICSLFLCSCLDRLLHYLCCSRCFWCVYSTRSNATSIVLPF